MKKGVLTSMNNGAKIEKKNSRFPGVAWLAIGLGLGVTAVAAQGFLNRNQDQKIRLQDQTEAQNEKLQIQQFNQQLCPEITASHLNLAVRKCIVENDFYSTQNGTVYIEATMNDPNNTSVTCTPGYTASGDKAQLTSSNLDCTISLKGQAIPTITPTSIPTLTPHSGKGNGEGPTPSQHP